jgi:hypothetical protein
MSPASEARARKVAQILSPFRLPPRPLTVKVEGCDGDSNRKLARKMHDKSWLPDPSARAPQRTNSKGSGQAK